MSMHSRGRVEFNVEGFTDAEDPAELSKLAMKLGLRFVLDPRPVDGDKPWAGGQLASVPGEGVWLEEIAFQVIAVESVTRDVPVDQVIEHVRKLFERRHFGPLDKKPSDNRPFGSGHVEGQ